ncbi:MAG: DUF4136 domain-containing protein [Cyclobacteriaceae bacterium]|nr:DUF4136 domain-containing protein [Cyclobacteriaceae bacterium]
MKKFFLALTGLIIAFSNYSLAQKVTIDYDKSVDFSGSKTYTFLGWQEDIDKIITDFDKKRIKDAFNAEMKKRNLKLVESDGDMVISLFIVVEQKTSTSAYTSYYGGAGAGYRRGGWGWGYGHSTTIYNESDYLQGTMVLNVFKGEAKDLIWQGVASKAIKENPDKREKSIPKVVAKLMKKYPIEPVL